MGGGAAPIAGAVEFGGGFWGGGMVWGPLVVVWLAIAAIAAGSGADWLQPIVTQGDADLWEAMGYFFAERFRLWPWPHLELFGNGSFFPVGVNHGFQAWGVERDLFYGLLYRLGGPGPWLRWYYLLSVALTLGGMALLLERCWGLPRRRAIAIAAIAVIFNGYGHGDKFPFHANIALIHWTVLGLVLDGAIARRAVRGQGIGLRWILGRFLLLILILGQDLGYIAGFGLLWATLTAPYALGWWLWWGRSRPLIQRLQLLRNQWGGQLRRDRGVWLLLGAIAAFAWLYLPVVAQIFFTAKSFDFSGTYGRDWWFSPWRLLLPWLPGVDPIRLAPEWSAWLGDRVESSRDGAVGWFLLILAAVGLGQGGRSRWASWVPLLVGLALAIAYRPLEMPTLQLFPWFSFNRVGGRVTVLLPTIFALLAAEARWPRLLQSARSRPWFIQRTITVFLLLLLGAVELATMYTPAIAQRQSTAPDPALLSYLEVVRDRPGSAVLDWPFCATGGNGVGADGGLCPYFGRNPSLHSLARFHRKKVMGHYFGRLHPDQIAPYLAQGWQYLFLPNSPDYLEATAQRRCFRDDEWDFFEGFYRDRAHDFAGINLYVDLLPAGCAAQFHQRFGPAIATAPVPGMGQVEFLAMAIAGPAPPSSNSPKSPPPQTHQFRPPYDGQDTDLVTFGPVRGIVTENLDRPRRDHTGTLFRWSLESETRLTVTLDRPRSLELVLDAIAIAPKLTLTVTVNGTAIAPQTVANPGDRLTLRLPLELPAGPSAIALKHPNPIRRTATDPAAGDRPLALRYQRLDLRPRTGNAP